MQTGFRNLCGLLALSALLTPSPPAHAQTPATVTITAEPAPRQTFRGFGTSIFPWVTSAKYTKEVTPAQNQQMAQLVFRDLNFKSVRLWMHPGQEPVSFYVDGWVKTGRLPAALKAGAKDLLLAPEYLPSGLDDGKGYIKDENISRYAAILADFIRDFKAQTGILINYTGILNEPNDRPVKFSDAQWPVMVKALRSALDARGLKAVKIVAPESASTDGTAYHTVDAIKSDPQAWHALDAIATHSYNMAATEEMAQRALPPHKDYWMTEASDNGPEVPGDTLRAASLASRVLNDLNHGVTHWIHFIGWEEADPNDNATRIIAYQPNPFRLTLFQKFYYYQQLSQTFAVGAVLRHATSDLEGEMTYTYGKKPRITAAVARNPDKTWAIGISNFTSPTFTDTDDEKDFARFNSGYAARTFTVTLKVPELANAKTLRFRIHRSSQNGSATDSGEVVMQNGQITIPNVGPLELVTLRSAR